MTVSCPPIHNFDIFPPGGNMTGGNMLVCHDDGDHHHHGDVDYDVDDDDYDDDDDDLALGPSTSLN